MNEKNKTFVQKYKDILELKNTLVYETNKKDMIKNISLLSIIILTIFIIIGIIFNTYENLNYMFYALSMVVIGSFVIYRLSEEAKFKTKYRVDYNILVAIYYDTITLCSVIVISNTTFFYLFINRYFTFVEFVILFIISIALSINRYIIEDKNNIYIKNSGGSVLYTSTWIVLLYIALFYILNIKSPIYTYIVSSGIIVFVYMTKLKLQNSSSKKTKEVSSLVHYLFAVGIVVFYMYFKMISFFNVEFIGTEPNIIDVIKVEQGTEIQSIHTTDEYIYVQQYDKMSVYNYDFNLITILEGERFYIYNDVLHSFNEVELDVYEAPYYGEYIQVFFYDSQFNKVDITRIHRIINVFTFEDEYVHFLYSYLNLSDGLTVVYDDFTFESISVDEFTESFILLQDRTTVIYYKDGWIKKAISANENYKASRGTYNNGKKFSISRGSEPDDITITIYDFDEYLNDEITSSLVIELGYINVMEFYYANNQYYFTYHDYDQDKVVFKVFDENGNVVEELMDNVNKIHVSEDIIIQVPESDSNTMWILDYDNPTSYIILRGNSIETQIIAAVSVIVLVLIKFTFPTFKIGILKSRKDISR